MASSAEVCARVLMRCGLRLAPSALELAASRDERQKAAQRHREVRWLFAEAQRLGGRDLYAVLLVPEPMERQP